MDCHEARMSLGVLVLGAIEPEERPALETHLAECASCSGELAQLAVLPGLLQRLDPDPHVTSAGEPPGLGARLRSAGSDLAAQRRRRARRTGIGAVAGVAAAAAAVAVLGVGRSPQVSPPHGSGTTVVATSRPGNPVGARFVLHPRPDGTLVSVSLHGVVPRQRCSLVAVGLSGRREVAAGWVASYSGSATVEGTTSLFLGDIARLEVVRPDGTALAAARLRHRG
jgi:hypothetical protein